MAFVSVGTPEGLQVRVSGRAQQPSFAVVIPMHNEADSVGPLLAEIANGLADQGSYQLVLVDDGSTDQTVAEIRRHARGHDGVRLLRHERRCGQSTAVYNGIRNAAAELVVVLDGDLQNDPADIPLLLVRFHSDPAPGTLGLLIGHRLERRDALLRRVGSRLANSVRARVLNDGAPDSGCGLKVIRRSVFAELPYFDHMHRFLPALVAQAGFRVISIPVRHRNRIHGVSHYGTLDRLGVGLVDLAGVAWLARRNRPKAFVEEEL